MKSTPYMRLHKLIAKFFSMLVIIGGVALISGTAASAQTNPVIEIFKPVTSSYPVISLDFRVFDDSGAFDRNLDLSAVHVIENNQLISPDSLELLEPGMRLIVAINEGPTLANRYAQVARIEKIKNALLTWSLAQPITTMNDLSLVINSGVIAARLSKPEDWLTAIENYQPELKQLKPGLSSLSAAVDLALSDADSNQTTALLYITPLPTEEENVGLQDLISRAKMANIRLFTWLVGPQTYQTEVQTDILRLASEETGGQFLIFSGAEELPSLSTYFDSLSYIYHAVYQSKIMTSGDFPLSLRINRDQIVLESDVINFTLNVLPPNPIFLSPPAKVERTWTETENIRDSILTPDTLPLHILVEFPDGLKRDLVYTRLFVDNQLVDENTSPPFEDFEWDISGQTESGKHTISASLQDSAGFVVQTLELPLEVIVQPKPQTWIEKIFSAFSTQTIVLFFVIAAAGLLLVLLAIRTLRINRKNKAIKSRRLDDPLTQPVLIENEIIHPKPKSATLDQWPHLPGSGLAPARLLLQSASESESRLPVEIPLSNYPITFGSDAKKSKMILPMAMISPLHARISPEEGGQFKLYDEGSGSGTWLNYAPVSQYGARLEHGDLIQFGTIPYRFEVYGSQPRKLKVEPLKEEE